MGAIKQWDSWVEGLRFYRSTHNGTRWLWTAADTEKIVVDYARGRVEYTTCSDLCELLHLRRDVLGPCQVAVQHALGWELAQIADEFPSIERDNWARLTDEFNYRFTPLLARKSVWIHRNVALSSTTPPEVAHGIHLADQFFHPSPLTRAWELWHIHREFLAAGDVLSRVIADLFSELEATTSDTRLLFSINHYADLDRLRALQTQIHHDFGLPGDPRRRVNQWDGWSMTERLYSPAAARDHFERNSGRATAL